MSIDPHLIQGNESPPVRNTILGTLLRGRRHSQSHERETSPDPPSPMMPPPGVSGGFSQMLRRRRSGGLASPGSSQPPVVPGTLALASSNMTVAPSALQNGNGAPPAPTSPPAAGTHRIRLVPHLDSRRSLRFDVFNREIKEGDAPLRIGRFTERSTGPGAGNNNLNGKIAFRSKVVSRAHAEMWVESGGRFFIRDTKSSSGTFLNHVRLSPANAESPPRQVRDGDIVQLGVDYQGGAEDIYKSVKIRIEVGREWQSSKNAFNTSALENLKALAAAPGLPPRTGKSNIPDCCICLFGVTIRQALFIAPCSHTFHYKCIRPLLENHHPAFSCPLCRTFADLEEDVEIEQEPIEDSEDDEPEKPLSPSVTINKKQKQKAREEREKERDREGGDTEVEGDAQAQAQARRNSRMSMMEENDEEDRYNVPNAWMVVDGEGGSSEAVHVGSSNDVVMHVEDKSDRSHSP